MDDMSPKLTRTAGRPHDASSWTLGSSGRGVLPNTSMLERIQPERHDVTGVVGLRVKLLRSALGYGNAEQSSCRRESKRWSHFELDKKPRPGPSAVCQMTLDDTVRALLPVSRSAG